MSNKLEEYDKQNNYEKIINERRGCREFILILMTTGLLCDKATQFTACGMDAAMWRYAILHIASDKGVNILQIIAYLYLI